MITGFYNTLGSPGSQYTHKPTKHEKRTLLWSCAYLESCSILEQHSLILKL
jgi:hypothetical protein